MCVHVWFGVFFLWGPWWVSRKESTCQCRRREFDPWVRKILWRRKWQPTPVFLLEKSLGQKSLADCSPRGHKESNSTEHTHSMFPASAESWKQRLQEQWECLMLRYRSLNLFPVKKLGLLGGVADLGLRHENAQGWALSILWFHKVRKWLTRKNKNVENLLIEQELLMAKARIIWTTEY